MLQVKQGFARSVLHFNDAGLDDVHLERGQGKTKEWNPRLLGPDRKWVREVQTKMKNNIGRKSRQGLE